MTFARTAVAAATLFALAACEMPQERITKTGQQFDVVAVTVDASRAKKTFGSAFSLEEARVEEIAQTVIRARLESADADGALPLAVELELEMLYLAGGAYLLLGSTTSGSRGVMRVTQQDTGAPLAAETELAATGQKRLGGLAGIVLVKGQETEMARVSEDYADKISAALFGE
ncbi:hypothetical protein RA2_03897 [Roseovarius sp. A-2]|uniref:hypothetical protein n=1 Tax=Roseovarius sp. A-2 TaxID=1570360 RepID=UPI0009B512D8|nr:hypothetical protein [Roseovarius sp. A-2]GAW36822.1 hypothetical protein RA2_03897 [Roseovarius sp. A-2]